MTIGRGRRAALCAPPLLLALALALAVRPAGADRASPPRAHAEGPPPGHTGGFGEPTCLVCHSSEEPNAPGGSLAVSGLPPEFEAGRSYELVVRLTRPEMLRAGFQLAIRHESGEPAGRQAGVLVAAGPGAVAALDAQAGITRVQHTLAGSEAEGGAAVWTLHWVAPVAGGAVMLHVAANAANDDSSPLGDYIYSGAWRTRPAP